jgi:hypothetical protein
MSWQYDKEPIDYLRQRIKYYQKKIPKAKNWINNKILKEKYGEEELRYIIARKLLSAESYIAMYKKAVKDLEAVEEMEQNELRNK